MRVQDQSVNVIDYRQANATKPLLPHPSILSSSGWGDIHLELFQQPKFEIAEHRHTMHVLACALPWSSNGEQVSCASGERWLDSQVRKESRNCGEIAVIPAHVPHRCNWDTSAQFMVLAIAPSLLQKVGQDWIDPDRIQLVPRFMTEQDALIQGIFASLKNELETGGIGGNVLLDSLKTALAIHLLRQYCTTLPKISNDLEKLSQPKLIEVKDYIHAHLHQELKLLDLAAIAQMSPYHFLRLFKQSLGMTPHQYILQSRIEKAKHLLCHSDRTIAEIALSVGFCDQSHLTRYFKRMVGVTPKQFLQS